MTMTKAAGEYLTHALERANAPEPSAVRILVRPDGLKTTIDEAHDGDQRFQHEGRTVLVLDPVVAAHLTNRTLDAEDDGSRLVCLT
ncbi:MAG: hypothetical protein KIT17_18500 [Rubrivivax sp.]|nr:hypothetical protein [Rubrivivax sp.]